MDILKLPVKNSELRVAKEKRAFLTYPTDGMASCTMEEKEDSIILIFEMKDTFSAKDILNKTNEEKLRFLLNCHKLLSLYEEYDFSLSLDNLVMDINLIPYVLLRDAHDNNSHDFLPKYKALMGSVLLPKYKYENYIDGGEGIYKKNKLLYELSELEDEEDIKKQLLEKHGNVVEEIKKNQKTVSKRSVYMVRAIIPLLVIILAVTAFFAGRFTILDIPYRDSVIAANQAYISGNFIDVQQALSSFDVVNLTHETKYILSRAYVVTEPLNDTQRNHILAGLTLMTDTSIFDYWIHIGRLQFDEAIDIAQRFGDNELLLFAFLKYEAVVTADPNMPGEEKVALLSYIGNHINRLQNIRTEVAGSEVFENLMVSPVNDYAPEQAQEFEHEQEDVLQEEPEDFDSE